MARSLDRRPAHASRARRAFAFGFESNDQRPIPTANRIGVDRLAVKKQ
jgi:hypothetical protein